MIVFALLLAIATQDHRTTGPASGDEPPPPLPARTRCDRDPDAITVCGNPDQSQFRLKPLPAQPQARALRPEVKLPGGGTAESHVEQRGIAPGISVPALMFSVHMPFGTREKPEQKDDTDQK